MTHKSTSRQLKSLFVGFLRDIIGDEDESMKIQHDLEANFKKRKTQDLEIDYLDDRCFVCFIGTGAENSKKIIFAKSGALLGYGDKEMKGMDYTDLIPKEFRSFHESADFFT
jgi:hypothetical protein